MRSAAAVEGRRTGTTTAGRRAGQRLTILSVLALVLGALVALGSTTPAQAAQAPGHDVPIYGNGWSWTYATTFTYNDGAGTNATINENVTYTNAGPVTFLGQDAYRLNITGTITGGSGSTDVDGVGRVNLSNFSGTVSGTRYVRRSDLALLQESQQQHLNGDAKYSIFTIDVTADIDLTMTPNPAWRTHDFPLNGGDSWRSDTDVAYTGGFNYSSSVASGNGPFDGTLDFDAPVTVSTGSIGVPIGTVATDNISATSSDGTVDNHWWSPTHKNDARHFMRIPMDDGAVATIDRRLSAASTPAPSATITETITPSLTCAGGPVTVAGKVGNTAGVPVSIAIDKSPINPGQKVTTSTTTTANGNYSATITAPGEYDGMTKNGSRANWGVLVSSGSARNVATLVVTPQSCSSIAYTGVAGAAHGTNATVSAKLTDLTGGGTGGRTVTFALSGGGSVNATTNPAGIATASLPIAGPPRTATITVSHAGSASLQPATATAPFEVGKIGTSTSVIASPSTATIGDPVTFLATVTPDHGSTPSGTVQFAVDGANFGAAVPLTGDTASSAPISTLGLGDHTVTATYNGDGSFSGSASPVVTFKVRNPLLPTTTTQTVSPTSSAYGEAVTLSSTVVANDGGTPSGSVTFTRGGTTLGSAALNAQGEAALITTTLPVGSYGIVATYSGDDTYNGSAAAPRTVTVAKAEVEVEVSSSDTTTVSGESVAFGASVAVVAPGGGTPQGTVQLVIDGTNAGAPVELAGGSAAFPPVTSLLAGNHTVSAVYSGSATHEGGSDSLTQEVAKADTTAVVSVSPSPSTEGQNVSITALISADAPGSGTPTGTVTFTADGDPIGAAPLAQTAAGTVATLDLADLAPGSYAIRASYAGDAGYAGGQSEAVSHTVVEGVPIVETTTSVTSSENPSIYGQLISFRAEVTADDDSTPEGAVQFSVDGTNLGDPVPLNGDGVAESPTMASPDPGDHTVIAAFQPAEGYSSSGWFLTQTVAAAGVDLALESSAPNSAYGQDVTFTATLTSQQIGTGKPTGFVQFRVDGEPLGDAVPIEDGVAVSPAVTDLMPGDHTVTALYSGDIRFEPALATYTQGVAKVSTTTALDVSSTSTTYGQAVELAATVTPVQAAAGAPGGTVSFKDGDTTLATVAVVPGSGSTGTASVTLSDLGAGSHEIRAVYSGSAVFESSSSGPQTVSVAKRATSIAADPAVVKLFPLGLPLGQLRITLASGTDPVAGAPIIFKIGTQTVCTSNTDAQGVATCNALPHLVQLVLALGYTATYAGDANHLGSTARGVILK